MKIIFILFCISFFTFSSFAQYPFHELDTNFTGKKILIPPGLKYDILFTEGEIVLDNDGKKFPSRGDHDYNCFISNEDGSEGLMYVSHETNDVSPFGDGGGATVFPVQKIHEKWIKYGQYSSVDFSSVGGTLNNCGGFYTKQGTVWTAEEFPPSSNKELMYSNWSGKLSFRDTSDFNGMKRFENMGWMVEVDPVAKKAIRKLYLLGRFSHEGAWIMDDNKTVFLTDDHGPCVFYKFIADSIGDFTKGQLYAYKQENESYKGTWIALPMEMDSLINVRDVAFRMGATSFVRHEWITQVDGKLYISESGMDDFDISKWKLFNGKLATHVDSFKVSGTKYDYPYGAVLQFDLETNEMKPLLFGGAGISDSAKHFSNPDGITHLKSGDKTYLIINEDLIALSKGRVPAEVAKEKRQVCEIYWLDLSIENPTIDDLQLFLIAPAGSETTGGTFSPDGKTYFVNIQHPDKSNAIPFNRSMTIAVHGKWFDVKRDKKVVKRK